MNSKLSYLFALPQKITSYRFLNTIGNSRGNISAHYDISNDMFAGKSGNYFTPVCRPIPSSGFLSQDMTYSCAIFEDLDSDLNTCVPQSEWSGDQDLKRLPAPTPPTTTQEQKLNGNSNANGDPHPISTSDCHDRHQPRDALHEAQLRKLHHIIQKAHILPGQRILEIGSGWGSLAILIAQTVPGTTIDTLTLSVQQQTLARKRIAEVGLDGRIEVHLMDYRHMPGEWEGTFDRVVSVEMIEAVGAEFLERYWGVVDWAMKRVGGVGVVQVITIPEARELMVVFFFASWNKVIDW